MESNKITPGTGPGLRRYARPLTMLQIEPATGDRVLHHISGQLAGGYNDKLFAFVLERKQVTIEQPMKGAPSRVERRADFALPNNSVISSSSNS